MKSAESRTSARFIRFFANRGAVDRNRWKHAPLLGFSHFSLKSQLPFLGLSPREAILLNVEPLRGAIRVGEWKLIVRATLPSKLELFDIANDPEESQNQADAYPDRVKSLLKQLNEYAYEMATPMYLEEVGQNKGGAVPIHWGDNPVRR